MARLKIRDKGEPREVRFEERVSIGRVDSCDVTVQDESCSREHCEVVQEDGAWKVRDLASSNGTMLNGKRVEESALADGDKIRIGATVLQFRESEADASIRFEEGEQQGETVFLGDERVTFGRRPNNALSFKDIKVSGVHVEIVREGEEFVLRDLGSTNGTQLDGRKIDEVILGHGDRVQFGEQVFVFEVSGEPPPAAAASTAAPSTATSAAKLPEGGPSKVRSLVAVVVLVGALGAAAWFGLQGGDQQLGGTKVEPPPLPAGSLLVEDWSFEDSGEVVRLWDDRGSASLGTGRGGARSGAAGMLGILDAETPDAESWREPVEVRGGEAYVLRGSWEVESGVRAAVMVRFLAEAPEEGAEDDESEELDEVTARVAHSAGSDGWEDFEATVLAPGWATGLSIGVLAHGEGALSVDDLALTGGRASEGTAIGNLQLADRLSSELGAAITLRRRMPLLEGFLPAGSESGSASEAVQATLPLAVERDGDKVRVDLSGSPRASAVRCLLAPSVALEGIDLMAESGGQRVGGRFAVDGVHAMVVGRDARRFEMRFSEPLRVEGIPRGDALWLQLSPAGNSFEVQFSARFNEQIEQANVLLIEAKHDHDQGRLGDALTKLRRVRDELPYDITTLETARERSAEMTREAERRLAEVEALHAAARFLDNLPRYEEALDAAEELLRDVQGTEVAATLQETVQDARERVKKLSAARREEEAARLRRTAEAFQAFEGGRAATAERLMEALEASYADTAAGREGGR